MRLPSKILALLINLLLGASWAFALIGALNALLHQGGTSWLYALASALIWALPGLAGVVLLEYLLRGFERHEEMLRQTQILEEIRKALLRSDSR